MTNREQALQVLKKAVRKADTAQSLEFLRSGGAKPIILCDMSGSMHSCDDLELSRLERLNRELGEILVRVEATVISFSDSPQLSTVPILSCGGGTALDRAILFAASFRPSQLVIISDGLPDDRDAALSARSLLGTTKIDVIYVGDPDNSDAQAFMKSLAQNGGQALTSGSDLRTPGQLWKRVVGMLTDGTDSDRGPIAL